MNYSNIYNQLINKALIRGKVYPAERHHILPKSMGGKDRKGNIVYFTPHEHLVAHILLWKIYRNKSMSHALWMMCHTRDGIRVNGRQYEILRLEHSKNISESLKGRTLSEETKEKLRQANLGKKHSEESCKKMSASQLGRKHSEETKKKMAESSRHTAMSGEHKEKLRRIHTSRVVSEETKEKLREYKGERSSFYGKHHTEETKKRMSESQKGKPGLVGENNPFYGKTHTDETKRKMSESAKNKPPITDETRQKLRCKKKPRPTLQCPHCEKYGDASGMRRWHFDNCKAILAK